MANILTEVGQKYAITRWREKFGTQPDVNSQEFKDFHKQVNRDYNNKYAQKASNGDNIASYRNKLAQILEKSPNSFPQEFYRQSPARPAGYLPSPLPCSMCCTAGYTDRRQSRRQSSSCPYRRDCRSFCLPVLP